MQILVYKTNLSNPQLANTAMALLAPLQGIHRCNIDLHDIDNILRIEAHDKFSAGTVEAVLAAAGFSCVELPD